MDIRLGSPRISGKGPAQSHPPAPAPTKDGNMEMRPLPPRAQPGPMMQNPGGHMMQAGDPGHPPGPGGYGRAARAAMRRGALRPGPYHEGRGR